MVLLDLTKRTISPIAVKWFRWAVGIVSFINMVILIPLWFNDVYLNEAILPYPGHGLWFRATHFLIGSTYIVHLFFLGLNFLASLLLISGKSRILACLILIYTGHNILNFCYPFLNMSQYLLLALTTYLLFMDEKADERKGAFGVVSRGLTNTFYIICWAQVLAAYIFPFFFKIQGEMWLNGTALGTILSIPEFSRNFILGFAHPDHWLFMLLTWATLLYQVAFPILIWWKKAKPYLLVVGVMFNLGIAITMGLVDIAVVMIAAYAILLDEATIEKMKSWVPVFRRRIAADLSSSA